MVSTFLCRMVRVKLNILSTQSHIFLVYVLEGNVASLSFSLGIFGPYNNTSQITFWFSNSFYYAASELFQLCYDLQWIFAGHVPQSFIYNSTFAFDCLDFIFKSFSDNTSYCCAISLVFSL